MAWTIYDISKEHMSMPPIYVGTLCITNGKVCMIFNFGSKDLWSRAKIDYYAWYWELETHTLVIVANVFHN